jgi:hypothetical protein
LAHESSFLFLENEQQRIAWRQLTAELKQDLTYNPAMALLILAVPVLLLYGVYRAARRWGLAAGLYFGAAVYAMNAGGVIAGRFWGPRYSWNFAHYGWDSLPPTIIQFCFCIGLALWFRNQARRVQ